MAEVFLRGLSRWQADTQRDAVADLYVRAYDSVPGAKSGDREEFLRRFATQVQRPGFEMVIAGAVSLAGCAYGFRAERAGGGPPELPGTLLSGLEEVTGSGQVFLLAELMVLPAQRRRHLATRMQAHLLARSAGSPAVAVTDPDNDPVRTAFETWGWTAHGPFRPDDTAGPQDVWVRRPGD
ncbi:hypothetical protein G5C51_15310 [Streptomyces sp. A7024]|uniref:N-acetyltransferase domain-containing protein n=1 Tax=Streptomyces coryli TaxID=1128680 RepID=A0A6G4TZT3_9ACTN|nr:hypothetical protein [Streptomyces coryli]NGN65262.1 hypothetical protein [Streptomyces coryli]